MSNINDFSNISIITYNISTVRQEISIYRQIITLRIKEDCSKMEQSFPFTLHLPQLQYYPLSFLLIIQPP
ncbi:hypothetical protein CON74_23915 [Bacillus thuringiensis]|nr:hypothetical protein CON74_23915 [Bacillus thuringiensis]PEE99913.1 hypothetical protein CON21_14195 [Bacillus thuringiensis]PFV92894.1 hypothetical protein COL21_19855 [Bacillus thuringiensis]PFW15549.1 hypothetical protein COL22_04715 [Bacillus thuringiensis]PGP32088.1 hypothetical protein CN987_04280 [Bacillus thuringiensis]